MKELKESMIYAVDLIRQGDEHMTTNYPTLLSLLESRLLKRVWLSYNSIAQNIIKNIDDIELTSVQVTASRGYNWITSTFITLKIIACSFRESANIFFMSATPLHYFLLTLISIVSSKKIRYFIIMHGELGYLNGSTGFGQKLGAWMIRASFRLAKFSNVTYISLGFPICQQLIDKFPSLSSNIVNLEIPSFKIDHNIKYTNSSDKIRIGSFGVHCPEKNSQKIYELVDLLDRNDLARIEMLTVGVAHQDFLYYQNKLVMHLCTGRADVGLIPREDFLSDVLSLDWALIFHGSSIKYELIPSGIFYDCVNYGIPIIGLHSKILRSYFNKYGELGVLCSSLDEMALMIKKISVGEIDFGEYKKNLKKISNDISFTNYRDKLHALVI
jgi:hypothetical protein